MSELWESVRRGDGIFSLAIGAFAVIVFGLAGLSLVIQSDEPANKIVGMILVIGCAFGAYRIVYAIKSRLPRRPATGDSVSNLDLSHDFQKGRVAASLAEGHTIEQCVANLISLGWSPQVAERFVSEIDATIDRSAIARELTETRRQQLRQQQMRGLFIAGAGLLITVLSFLFAREGGSYVVAWGAILFGIIDWLIGLVRERALAE